jgi:hypothetical protein
MTSRRHSLLMAQGYSQETICTCNGLSRLARWTPAACASLGLVGVLFRSPQYLIALGLLTAIGALGDRSFYDYIYVLAVRRVWDIGEMPGHGSQRRFGCGIGAGMFVLSGVGFWAGNAPVAYGAAITIIGLAAVAATTHWCFASALYNGLFKPARRIRSGLPLG